MSRLKFQIIIADTFAPARDETRAFGLDVPAGVMQFRVLLYVDSLLTRIIRNITRRSDFSRDYWLYSG